MFRLSQVSQAALLALGGSVVLVSPAVRAQDAQQPQTAPALERVEITGSAVRRIQGETALPVQILRREDIDRSGATSVTDLIQNLPSMQKFTNEGTSVGGGGNGFAGASIHNLDETRTLVLLNGRRLATFAGQNLTGSLAGIDLNSIPLAAVERVEVLTDGASALYGSDAIAGVLNFITKRNFSATDITVGGSAPRGGAKEKRVSVSKGFGQLESDGFNVLLSANYEERTKLEATSRSFAATGVVPVNINGRNVVFFNGSPRSIPGNVTTAAGALVNPYLIQNGVCPPNHVRLEDTCYYDYVSQLEIYPERDRGSVMGTLNFKLGQDHTLFADVLVSRTRNTSRIAPPPGEISLTAASPFWPSVLIADPAATGTVIVPYRVSDVGKRTTEDRTDAQHFVVGVEGAVAGWDYNTAVTHSKNDQDSSLHGGWVKLNALFDALDSGLVNPFVLPGNQSPAAMRALQRAVIKGFWEGGTSTLDNLEARVSKPIYKLPAGDVSLAAGVNYLQEKFQKQASDLAQFKTGDTRFGDTSAIIPFSADRHSVGLFVEALVPVWKDVEFTASVRNDNYSDFGNATTGKLSLRYQPTRSLLFRGSIGTGFKAPTVPQVNATEQDFGVTSGNYTCNAALLQIAAGLGAVCPAGNVQYNVKAGGNKELQAEKSNQAALGFRFEPTSDVSVGADLWMVRLKNQIDQLDETILFGDPLKWRDQFTSYTDPGTGEKRLAILQNTLNLGQRTEAGIDFDAKVRFGLPIGRLTSQLQVTRWLKDKYQLETGGPYFSSLGRFGEDGDVTFRWQGRLTNTLEYGAFAHTLGINFKSGYKDQQYTAADGALFDPVTFESFAYKGRVKRYYSVDWQTMYRVSKMIGLTVGVLNVFDKDPPVSLKSAGGGQQIGYDDRYYDPRGRTWYLNASFQF